MTACARVHVRVYAYVCADDNLYIWYLKSKNILYLLHTVEPAMPDQRIESPSVSLIFSNINREIHAKLHEIRVAETRLDCRAQTRELFLRALFSELICLQSGRSQ